MTSHYAEDRETGIPAVLAQIQSQVRGLADTLWAARDRDELMDTIAQIEALKASLDGLELGVVRELDATQAVKAVGWACTQDFLTAIAGGHKGTGPAVVRLAVAVDQPVMAPVGEALTDGWLCTVKAQVIDRAIDALPGDPDLRARGGRCCWMRRSGSMPPSCAGSPAGSCPEPDQASSSCRPVSGLPRPSQGPRGSRGQHSRRHPTGRRV